MVKVDFDILCMTTFINFSNELIALDNNNIILSVEYDETFDYTESEQLINRHNYSLGKTCI